MLLIQWDTLELTARLAPTIALSRAYGGPSPRGPEPRGRPPAPGREPASLRLGRSRPPVEILGAVSGFPAGFGTSVVVLGAGIHGRGGVGAVDGGRRLGRRGLGVPAPRHGGGAATIPGGSGEGTIAAERRLGRRNHLVRPSTAGGIVRPSAFVDSAPYLWLSACLRTWRWAKVELPSFEHPARHRATNVQRVCSPVLRAAGVSPQMSDHGAIHPNPRGPSTCQRSLAYLHGRRGEGVVLLPNLVASSRPTDACA